MGKIISVRGAKQEDISEIAAGDIGVVTKLSNMRTGDTLCSPKKVLKLAPVSFPEPCLSMAVKVAKKGEEEKVAAGLFRLMEEDPTITFRSNHETHEQILSGLGEQHLDVIVSKLKTKFGVDVSLACRRWHTGNPSKACGGAGPSQEAVRRPRAVWRCVYPL